jgi:two-component system chemotaxis sensor kinase CheA
MDDLLNDFLAETSEHIEAASSQLVQFEIEPTNIAIVASIFRLVHTIKGTCGFLGLSRLEKLAHAAEAVVSLLREGSRATPELVTLILAAVDRIRLILAELERHAAEPPGDDSDLIEALESHLLILEGPAGGGMPDVAVIGPGETPRPATIVPAQAPAAETHERDRRPETIRVEVGTLERMMVLVSELVLTRNQLLELSRRQEDEAVKAPMQRLSALTSDLQDSVMRARMQPLSRLFARLPRLIRELGAETRKKLVLVVEGGETELDRQLVEVIRDPLTHMLRNAADHGIEMPEARVAAGKSEVGTIHVAASHEAGYITITISDDGRGLDLERIKAKALSRGLVTPIDLERMSDDAIFRFIFLPEFSTAAQVTNISGRGIGLDVVRDNIETIGGSISVAAKPGKGTSFSLKIPLTLAIAPALIVEVAHHRFALPQQSVIEAIGFGEGSAHRVERVQGSLILRLRNQVIPLVDVRAILNLEDAAPIGYENQLAVVMRVGTQVFGIIVDHVTDVQEVVVKPLGASLAHLIVFSGHTILGDGSVVLILDPAGIANKLGLVQVLELGAPASTEAFVPPREKTRLILFRAGTSVLKVVPLSLISRIESVKAEAIQISDGMRVMQHRGFLMPLIVIADEDAPAKAERPVLVLGIGGESVGLIVDEIIDIVEDFLEIEIASATAGTIGTAHIQGTVVEIIDISHFVKIARPDALARGIIKRFAVLLVDDRLFFRDMLSPILAAAGYRVTTASSGRDALSMLNRGATFHVIVTDTDMPDMDGYTLAREIKSDPRNANVPIIALAAHAAPIISAAAAASGMCGVVGKFDRCALLDMIRVNLGARELGTHKLEERIIREFAA